MKTGKIQSRYEGNARKTPLLPYGLCFIALGFLIYISGVVAAIPRNLFDLDQSFLTFNEWVVWYSGVPVMLGLTLSLIDLFVLLPKKRKNSQSDINSINMPAITVVLTAYDDEKSIATAVHDFAHHPSVHRVIVVDNNSHDKTSERARDAGAFVIHEPKQGYGQCVRRCLIEANTYKDTNLVVLCEGDRTFRAADIEKLLAYIQHAHIVNGTRICEQLRQYDTQLSTFMYYGNFFVAKLMEAKYVGQGTFTDLGTTYKLIRANILDELLDDLNSDINLEFNAYFLDQALARGYKIVECPITFWRRVGESKGGNRTNLRAFIVGCCMIKGILFGWPAQVR